jgi:hypothetical protein
VTGGNPMLAVLILFVPAPDLRLAVFADVSTICRLETFVGKPVQVTRVIEYDGDRTVVTFEETETLPELRATFPCWELPYEFDDEMLTNPQRVFVVTVRGKLGVSNGHWTIEHPSLVRWR